MTAITNFDATAIPPQQGGGAHPPGIFPFVVGNTYGQENKKKDGGMLVVQFTTQVGQILNYYNLFNPNEKAVEIARKELSALCHATGAFKLSFEGLPMDQWARELRGTRGVVEIGPQVGNEQYMEVKKVFDAAGNEPGKPPGAAPQPAPQSQPGAQGGGWGQPPATPPASAQAPASGGWQPGPAPAATGAATGGVAPPPWATK